RWPAGGCAAIFITGGGGAGRLAGHAGELHPRAVEAFRLPSRTCAAEIDLSVIEAAAAALGPVEAPVISPYPVATQDVALVVPASVPAAAGEAALSAGAAGAGDGRLLEGVALVDGLAGG